MENWTKSPLLVAVGLVFNAQGEILVALRQAHQEEPECWEFPGGKIETDETEAAALKRELHEEVGIEIISHEPWLVVDYADERKAVSLKVHKVLTFKGEPYGREGQRIQWLFPHALSRYTFPRANSPILQKLLISF